MFLTLVFMATPALVLTALAVAAFGAVLRGVTAPRLRWQTQRSEYPPTAPGSSAST